MLTRKEFKRVAKLLSNRKQELKASVMTIIEYKARVDEIEVLEKELSEYFDTQNPRFNKELFHIKSGIEYE